MYTHDPTELEAAAAQLRIGRGKGSFLLFKRKHSPAVSHYLSPPGEMTVKLSDFHELWRTVYPARNKVFIFGAGRFVFIARREHSTAHSCPSQTTKSVSPVSITRRGTRLHAHFGVRG